MNSQHKIQTREEEVMNAVTHSIGVLLILSCFPILYHKSSGLMVWAVSIFGFGMLMSYMASSIYHWVQEENVKKKVRVWDHIGIFLLIGGTYTPIVCRYTNSSTAIIFLTAMWSIIIIGSVLKLFFTGRYDGASTAIYLFLGWMVIFIYSPVRASMPFEIFMWILAGGLSYTLGVIFYKWRTLKYQHSIWHLFVLAGTIFQFIAVYKSL
jgi:hemolysin III